jgi:hypothetical protein
MIFCIKMMAHFVFAYLLKQTSADGRTLTHGKSPCFAFLTAAKLGLYRKKQLPSCQCGSRHQLRSGDLASVCGKSSDSKDRNYTGRTPSGDDALFAWL